MIELIVVILILAILAAILVPAIISYVDRARDSRDKANARAIYSEVAIKVASDSTYVSTTVTEKGLVCTWNIGTDREVNNFLCKNGEKVINLDDVSP